MMSDLTLSDRFNNLLNCCDNLGEALEPFNRLFFIKESENIILIAFKDASYTIVFRDSKDDENTIHYFSGENMFDRKDFLENVLSFLREYPKYIKEIRSIIDQLADELKK